MADASRHLEQIKALATAARRVVSAPDLASTLDTITGAAREIIGAHQAVCSLTRGPDWSQAINAVSLSDRYAAWRDYAPMPDGSGIYAWICEGNRTVRMTQADLEAHPRWRGFGVHAGEHPPMRGWLAAAVVGTDGRNLGLVQLSDKIEGEFDEADEAIVVQLAQFAASAIERSQTEGALRGSEARFRELADNISQLAWMAEPSGAIFWYNRRWYDYTGTTLEEMQGWGWRNVHHPDHVDRVIAEVQAHWAAGIAWEGTYLLRSAQGEFRSFLTRAEPIRNEAGELVRWIGTNTDISERIRAEAENARLVAIVSSSSDAIVSVSAEDRRISTWNRAAEAMFGYSEAEAIGAPAGLLVPLDHRTEFDTERGVFERTMQDGQVRFDSVRRRKDGTLVDVSISATRMVSAEGRVIGVSAIFRDITERKRWEEHQRLLINELNHRVKNTLATVQSIATQTLRNAGSVAEAREAFESRLMALSRAHDVLTRENWDGADLTEIVEQAVSPYAASGEERLHVHGPRVRLSPRRALALAMGLQELATNAAKYGALSRHGGAVRIIWTVDGGSESPRLALGWEESGGPLVTPPTRKGFGSRLIERSLAQDLDATVRIDFAPTGLVCSIDLPLTAATASDELISGNAGTS